MNWKRWGMMAAVLAAVVLAIGYGFRPQPVLVETAAARRGPLRVTIDEEGKTRVTDRYVVSAPVAGYARRVTLDVGDAVQQGQVLLWLESLRPAVLDPRARAEAEARVAAAEAALRAAREKVRAALADDAYWEGQAARVARLYKSGDISRENYDRTVAEARRASSVRQSAQHEAEAAEAGLASARAALEYSPASRSDPQAELVPVRAPVAGRVLKVLHESEGVVTSGQALLEIANARALEVQVEVLSADAVRITPGMRVLFERWGGPAPLEGRVRRIEPVAFTKVSALGVEEQRVLVIVDFTSPQDQWKRLGDQYRVEASFILWEGSQVLQIPASALFRFQEGWAVFVVEGRVARRRAVTVGRRNGLSAEILSGLSEGDVVITHPDTSVEDGTPVAPRSGG